MRTVPLFSSVIAALTLFGAAESLAQQPIAQIGTVVSTPFGNYVPFPVPSYEPLTGLGESTLTRDLSNIASGEGFTFDGYFSASERALLQQNNFVARPEAVASFGAAYAPDASNGLGSFVTTDAILHGLRVTIDEAQRQIERDYMMPQLSGVLSDLSKNLGSQLTSERDPHMAQALRGALAYMETGRLLLDNNASIDSRVSDAVQAEVRKIRAAGSTSSSSVLPNRSVNYALFAPTGHYQLNESFRGYYQAMQWLTKEGFSLRDQNGNLNAIDAREAALISRTMDLLGSQGDFRDRYNSVYETAAFFNGRTDADLTPDVIGGSLRGYYGAFIAGSSNDLAGDSTLAAFVDYTEKQAPRMQNDNSPRVFRLFTEGSTPEQLAGNGGGLAVMASLGNPRATALAQNKYAAARQISSHPAEEWVQSLPWAVLYTSEAMTLPADRNNGYPKFMRTSAWRDLELSSALGSNADYQHDVQFMPLAVSSVSLARGNGSAQANGYVEPNPEAWGRIATLAKFVESGLTAGGNLPTIGTALQNKLRDIENTSAAMMQIAALELNAKGISSTQAALVATMPTRIAAYETFADKTLQPEGSSIVAGAISGSATGHPLVVYVVAPRNDGTLGLTLTRGAVYSYFEPSSSQAAAWTQTLTSSGASVKPNMGLYGSFAPGDKPFTAATSELHAVTAALPALASYTQSKDERSRALPDVKLELESNVVRQSTGELWYTVKAPKLDGNDVAITVVDQGGRVIYRSGYARLQGGTRYDLVRVENLPAGPYFIRVNDNTDRMLAAGRFLVVR